MIHIVKGFSLVNEAEVDVFLDFPCFLIDPMNVDNLISDASAFSKPSFYVWKFLVHMLLKPSLKDFEHNLASMKSEHNCMAVWTVFVIAVLWDWNKNCTFLVLWLLLSFPSFLMYWVQPFNIWNFTVHIRLKPGLENFEHYFTSMWDECSCVLVWAFFCIVFLWFWNEHGPFPVLWPLLSFPNLLAYWVQHFHSIIFQDLK